MASTLTTMVIFNFIVAMKNIFKSLMLVAVAAMGIACQEKFEENIAPINPNEVVMTITADVDETRTYIDETNNKVKWSAGDQLKVIENSAVYRTTTAATIDADGKAKFAVSFPANTSASEFTYSAVFPATAVTEDDAEKIDATKIKVTVKDQQNATATSFDPQADVLVAKQVVVDAQPTELNMQFKRLVAMGKMTLKNLPADAEIEKVIFTASTGKGVAGRNYVDATAGEVSQYCYYGKTNVLTVNYDHAISTRDIYFTCNPFEMAAGETFTVKAVCGDKSYTREVEIPADRSLVFTEGDLSTFSVDMANATVEGVSAFAEGKYVVIAKNGSKYYAMKGVKGSGNYMTYAEVEYDGAATTFDADDETLVWDIAAVDGGFTLQNYEGKYLYGSNSGNYAYLGDAQTLTLSLVDGTAQQYYIAIKSISERILGYNTNSGQERFAFYKVTQANKLYLVPVAETTEPYFTISQDVMGYTADGDEIEFEVIAHNGFNATVTATTDAEWISFVHNGDYIYATAEPNEGDAREAVITFSADGYKSVEVTVKQDAGENVGDGTITVAKFLELKDTATEYQLTGKITSVANTTYGNFDLTDATGTVYVYGLLTPEGTAQKQWAAAGLKQGDIITIKGKYSVYNGSPQIKNAIYVSHVPAPFISAANVSVSAEATTATINVESNVAWSVTCSETWVTSYTQSGENNGAIEIVMEVNELTENREAIFTLTADEVAPVTVKLTQLAISTGDGKTVLFDFTAISGFNSWGNNYSKRTVEYDDATVIFTSANKQSSTISNMPVTKGNPVEIKAKNGATMKDVMFVCKQWNTKAQTITLHYSTDGGTSYTSTGITSTNFAIECDSLPEGANAVKLTFSSQSNQIGIQEATVTFLN